MYATAMYFVLKRYYAAGNTGIPNPQTMVGPTYLYIILALASDFFGGAAGFIGAGLTVAMIWDAEKNPIASVPSNSVSTSIGGEVIGTQGPAGIPGVPSKVKNYVVAPTGVGKPYTQTST